MNFHSSVVIYIRLIEADWRDVDRGSKNYTMYFPYFLLWNRFWRSKTSNRYCSYFICYSPCRFDKLTLPSGKGFGGFIIEVMKKSFSLGHEITRGRYNLYSAFSYILNSPVPVAVSLKGKQTRKKTIPTSTWELRYTVISNPIYKCSSTTFYF